MQQISVLETNIGSSTTGNSNDTEIIFNDAGTLRGDKDFAWNKTSNILTVDGSATITGDLTVRTNRLATTTTGVGIGTASPNSALEVAGSIRTTNAGGSASASTGVFDYVAGTTTRFVSYGANTTTAGAFQFTGLSSNASVGDVRYGIDATGIHTWQNVGGVAGTAMTLNSTGLGVGEAASVARLQPRGSTSDSSAYVIYAKNSGGSVINFMRNDGRFLVGNGTTDNFIVTETGNVGIGVTPSAWSSMLALQVRGVSLACDATVHRGRLLTNAFYDGAGYKYIQTNFASMYLQNSLDGAQSWHTAPSGTAGQTTTVTSGNSYTITAAGGTNYTTFGAANNNVGTTFTATSSGTGNGGGVTQNITFTQAMTLSATGQLLLGTSSTNGGVDIGMVMNKPSATGFVGNVYQLNGVDKAFAYIASAASAYTTETVSGYIIRAVSATNGVYLANGGISWLALSDERFKDIIEPISNAVAKVSSLRSVIGKFKTESEGTRRPFLIAQDVQAVLPEAVDATKPDQLGVSYSDVIPLLVAAIKELTARVQTLETR